MILFIKHIEIEGPESLGTAFVDMGYDIDTCELYAGDRLPADPSTLDAVVALGGPMNVYEEDQYPFLKEVDAFLKKVVLKNVPFLGICLGSQLLAKATGGSVVRSPQEEIGWSNIILTESGVADLLFQGWPQEIEVYQWHGDMCVPANGAVHLASSEACPMQAFRVGRKAYGLQFHAEITAQSIVAWSQAYRPGQDAFRETMLTRYREVEGGFRRYGRLLCENFDRVIRGD